MDWDGFQWDRGNWPKCAKHGLDKASIEAIFDREDTSIFRDGAHSSAEEDRYFAIAAAIGGHPGLFVGFTLRKAGRLVLIRPVTARYMHAKEVRRYGRFKE